MNAKRFTPLAVLSLLLVALAASACSPVAHATPVAYATQAVKATQIVKENYPPLPTAAAAQEAYAPTPIPTPADNYFEDYGVNPYVDTQADHLSTFAIDVDTASYSVARRYVQDGQLPPPEAARVEEFINYFQQDYANPPDSAFALHADGAPSPFHTDGTYLVRVGLQGYQVPESQRKSAALTFVIDVSGSMSMENRLELVKRSLELLVERLRPDDTIALVVYGSTARVVLPPTSGRDQNAILSAIHSLYPEGATNAEAGLQLGYATAAHMLKPDGINRVILCSDGVANVGNTGPDEILKSIRWYALEYGINLTSIGVGMGNFNDVLLEQLANDGNGNYAYVDDLDEARKVFVDDLTGTLQVIALDAKIQVDFNPDVVRLYRLIGYENRALADEDFRNNAADAGEVGAGHTVTALYAVQLSPNAQGRLATLSLRWKDPETYAVSEINRNVNTWDLLASFDEASARYQQTVLVAQYAELLRQSPYAGRTNLRQLARYAANLTSRLPYDADVQEFAQLVQRAADLGW